MRRLAIIVAVLSLSSCVTAEQSQPTNDHKEFGYVINTLEYYPDNIDEGYVNELMVQLPSCDLGQE